jgi:hypothetical protein
MMQMRKGMLLFGLVCLILLSADANAWAVPGPLPEAEMLAASELVALVRVLSATCVAVFHERHEELRRYSAALGILRVRKGSHRRYDTINVRWQDVPRRVLGPWIVPYYPGDKGWTYLTRFGDAYTATWINAADEMDRRGGRLPIIPMQTIWSWSPGALFFRAVTRRRQFAGRDDER